MARESELPTNRPRERLPSGAVTFVFTDIEGSTQRWEQYPAAMKAAVKRHDGLLREAIRRHDGYVFKTVGDAFCAVFHTPADALGAALEMQHELVAEPFDDIGGLSVRIALHTGSADERQGDYFGSTVNRTERLMSLAHGGQVLVSNTTRELLRDDEATDCYLIDLGVHRLKDLTNPERVWQAVGGGLRRDFPPLQSPEAHPNNLPAQVTSFLGRERDMEELKEHVHAHRLVTLFGAGGVGKTRMAVQLGAELLDQFSDGVWIADFAPIGDPELVPRVVGRALGIARTENPSPNDTITVHLKQKQLLMILDDCEHLVDSVAGLADSIHRSCPHVHMVATSRQALGVSGEKVVRLASLAIPERGADLAPEVAITFGAVSLFVDRAVLVDGSFALSAENAPLVASICRRLDGIPFAIELAAARAKVMGLASIATRLDERFKLLTGGSRTALARQKTLMALIDWSYGLLSTQEQRLLHRVAVFANGFSLAAATEVCSGEGVDAAEILDLVMSLAEKSLLVPDIARGEDRYRLLESTREYALEKLTASGEHAAMSAKHAEYFAGMALGMQQDCAAVPLAAWLGRTDLVIDDFRAAMTWSMGDGHAPMLGAAITVALESFWWHGAEAEGRRWIALALRRLSEPSDAKALEIVARLQKVLALLTSRVLFS